MAEVPAAPKPRLTVYDCKTQAAEIATLAATITESELYAPTDEDKLGKFDNRVQPWKEDCDFRYHRYHFVVAEGTKVLGWMLVDIRTHTPQKSRTWTYVYLDKVSVRNGTRGIGKELGDYLKEWATNRGDIDFVWLWAIDKNVGNLYEKRWDYNPVKYYDEYGFMFYTIKRPPPLSWLQSELPESPRKLWVVAHMIATMKPRNEYLLKMIAEQRRYPVGEDVKVFLESLMELDEISSDEVEGVQKDLADALKRSTEGGRRTRRFKMPRLMTKKYCKKTPCRRMGFTQRASCRPYKNCYTRRRSTKERKQRRV